MGVAYELIVFVICVLCLIYCLGLYGNVRRARIALEQLRDFQIAAKRQEVISQAAQEGAVVQEAPPKDHTYSMGERIGIAIAMVVIIGFGLLIVFSYATTPHGPGLR